MLKPIFPVSGRKNSSAGGCDLNRVSNVPPTLRVGYVGDVFRWLRKLATGYFPVAPPALKEKSRVLNRTLDGRGLLLRGPPRKLARVLGVLKASMTLATLLWAGSR